MEDYKWLVERLKYYGHTYAIGDNLGREIERTDEVMLSAAEVIERLVNQKNALLNELKGFCWCCKNVERLETKEGIPLFNCKYMGADKSSLYGRSGSGCRHWQWRGIQGGDKDA